MYDSVYSEVMMFYLPAIALTQDSPSLNFSKVESLLLSFVVSRLEIELIRGVQGLNG